jgi:hypothetical protein
VNEDTRYEVVSFGLDCAAPYGAILIVCAISEPFNFTSYLHVGPIVLHSATLVLIIGSYALGAGMLEGLAVPSRELSATCLTLVGIHLYDVMWGLGSFVARGSGFPLIPLISLVASSALLLWFESKYVFLRWSWWGAVALAVGVVCFGCMVYSGWYQAFTLYEAGGGADPHNFVWALGKFMVLLAVPLFVEVRGETRVIRMDLM